MSNTIDGFQAYPHCHNQQTRQVWVGGTGPLVFLLHEIPNPTPQVFDLGRRLIASGYQVHIPVFFGEPNVPFSERRAIAALAMGCIRKEFAVFAKHRSSPIIDWIKSLCEQVMASTGHRQVGMIGMCFTGNFALGLCAEPWMKAPILSQPSLPYPISENHQAALHASPAIMNRARQNPDTELLGLRFSEDWMCPKARFDSLQAQFGERFEAVEIDSTPDNPHQIKATAHAVLTMDFVDREGHPTHDAWLKVLDFLARRLEQRDSGKD